MLLKDNIEWEIQNTELDLKEQIGVGSFGIVKHAMWRGTDVAAKVLNSSNIDTTEFYTETNILSKLHHPNILQFLGSCTKQNPYMILMEYMINGSLHDYVNKNCKKSLTYNMKIDIVKDIAKGLAYLHNRKPQCIIHRDLKPSNILLTASFKAKIADFGISSLQSKSNEIYEMTGETGTYRFMAPEVMEHSNYSTKVDIWSFGMVIYNIFVEYPYNNLSINQIFHCIKTKKIPLKKYTLSYDLEILLENMLKLNADERWDSMYIVNYCNNDLIYKKNKYVLKCFY